jgi:hypothetical protein
LLQSSISTKNFCFIAQPETAEKAPGARRDEDFHGGVPAVRWSENPQKQQRRWTFAAVS